ncbi:MAG: aminotransferase class V-fold PLP-dependent enzyme [Spirochaetota bacterium]
MEIPELQTVVQQRIAAMTQNEAAAVCNGAASGLYLCAVSAVALKLNKPSKYLSLEELAAHEILSFSAQHIPYDFAVKQSGIRQTWVGYPNIEGSMVAADLEAAIRANTAAIYYYISSPYGLYTPGVLPLEEVLAIARKHDIPVIVDAAAQLPPRENLWKFTAMGAAAAIFSGGKYLKGPQSSGLIVGKKSFLEMVQETNFPNYGYGRMLKTGREEIIGLYSAIQQYLDSDCERERENAEETVREVLAALQNSSLYQVERVFPNEAAQPLPYVRVGLNRRVPAGVDLESVIDLIRQADLGDPADSRDSREPAVFVKPEGPYFYINPMTLPREQVSLVIEKLISVETLIHKEAENAS